MSPAPLFLASLAGCGGVRALYEDARTEALADPTVGPGWRPDARIDLSLPLLDGLFEEAVVGTRIPADPIDVGVATLHPKLTIQRLALVDAGADARSLTADLRIAGPIDVVSVLGSTEQNVALDARLSARLDVDRRGSDYAIVVTPTGLDRLQVEAEGLVTQAMAAPLRSVILAAIPPLDVAKLPGESLPIREIAVTQRGDGVTLRIRTAAPDPRPLPDVGDPPAEGFRIAMGAATLQQLARRQAFVSDALTHNIVPELTSLALTPSAEGADFQLGVRLWHVSGGWWWRTVAIDGGFRVEEGQLAVKTRRVEELDQSSGAVFADPLVALVEGQIWKGIQKAMTLELPTERSDKVGAFSAASEVMSVAVVGDALVAIGDVSLERRRPRRKDR